jgi:preprotein translocase SecE subunit
MQNSGFQEGIRRVEEKKRNVRVRKTAPTVRERAEAARIEAKNSKPKRWRRVLGQAKRPFAAFKKAVSKVTSRIHLPDNRFGRILRRVGRFLKRILSWLVPHYFINSWRELRLVKWPGRGETWRLTGAVFVFAIVFGVLVAGVDKGLDLLFKKFVLK